MSEIEHVQIPPVTLLYHSGLWPMLFNHRVMPGYTDVRSPFRPQKILKAVWIRNSIVRVSEPWSGRGGRQTVWAFIIGFIGIRGTT